MSTNPREPILKPLSAYASPPTRPVYPIAVLLVEAAATLAASQPFPWHHAVIPAAGYQVIRGVDGATWVAGIAALCLVMAAVFWRKPPEFYSKWSMGLIAFAATLGMFVDYINWMTRGAQLHVTPYFGPGFYIALAGTAIVVTAMVRTWFVRV